MKFLVFIFAIQLSLSLLGQQPPQQQPAGTPPTEMPRDAETQEQLIFLSARVKNLAEVQDLILKQQQLILQHMDALRKDLDKLQGERTNLMTRGELQGSMAELEQIRKQIEAERRTNLSNGQKGVQDLGNRSNLIKGPVQGSGVVTNKFEPYRVQAGETLSRITARWNETLEKQGLPKLTQEQIEAVNPSMNPDRLRVGQTIYLPVPGK